MPTAIEKRIVTFTKEVLKGQEAQAWGENAVFGKGVEITGLQDLAVNIKDKAEYHDHVKDVYADLTVCKPVCKIEPLHLDRIGAYVYYEFVYALTKGLELDEPTYFAIYDTYSCRLDVLGTQWSLPCNYWLEAHTTI